MAMSVAKVLAIASKGFDSAGDLVFAGTLTRVTAGTYNPATGLTTDTTATYSCRVVQDVLIQTDYANTAVVPATDTAILVEGLTATPIATDKITFDGKTLNVIQSKDYSAGSGALYRLIVRGVGNV